MGGSTPGIEFCFDLMPPIVLATFMLSRSFYFSSIFFGKALATPTRRA